MTLKKLFLIKKNQPMQNIFLAYVRAPKHGNKQTNNLFGNESIIFVENCHQILKQQRSKATNLKYYFYVLLLAEFGFHNKRKWNNNKLC